ncbi:MAG: hypothetical protein Q9218_000604 [Villophora microphyllina]
MVESQYRAAGITVPYISNDAAPHGYLVPGTGNGSVDIYGHDAYPLGFDCANPYTWPDGALPINFRPLHLQQSPSTPYSLVEFQGGSFDPWGGSSFTKCTTLLNEQFERVFYKNDYSFGVTIFNIYMVGQIYSVVLNGSLMNHRLMGVPTGNEPPATYCSDLMGSLVRGNLGHPGGYTSYDYGAVIAEDRTLFREKYSEAKLQANFLRVSPDYLTAIPGSASNGSFVNTPAIATTQLKGNHTNFYVVRHAAFNSLNVTTYTITIPSSAGNVTIPRLNSMLTLNGRDSKIHVTDYDVGGHNLLYSSAEIFTWKRFHDKTVLILYGGAKETHEAAFSGYKSFTLLEGAAVESTVEHGALVINWTVKEARRAIQLGSNFFVYLLGIMTSCSGIAISDNGPDRRDCYKYWVLDLPGQSPYDNYTASSPSSVIARAGYLLRTVSVAGNSLSIFGDLNETVAIEVIGGAPENVSSLRFNGQKLATSTGPYGVITGTAIYNTPIVSLPNLTNLEWKYVNGFPEIGSDYDDSAWPKADIKTTQNPRELSTPTSLYGSDYGFNTGNLLFRGHFIATGAESNFQLRTQGGAGYGASVFLNRTLLGSWVGNGTGIEYNQTLPLPPLREGQPAVLTVLLDNMGLDENGKVGTDQMKNPRGILNYTLAGRDQSAISWKVTGNLGGEHYHDRTRGPLNEGGLYAERQGYHLPNPPSTNWQSSKPTKGIPTAGVAFYTTRFNLSLPSGYDIPLSFVFTNSSSNSTGVPNFRCQFYVNGYQFGKYGTFSP